METAARYGFVALCLGVSVGVYFLVAVYRTSSPKAVWVALFIALISLVAYLAAYQRFVCRIDIQSRSTAVYVSVGYDRTAHAEQTFGSASDWEMLRARGTADEEITQLWTRNSLIVARLGLFLSCALTTLALLFVFSVALMHDINAKNKNIESLERE